MCKSFSWSEQYAARRRAAARWGPLARLPLAKRASDVVLAQVSAGGRVLEVGAAERRMEARIVRARQGVSYRSCDLDPAGAHDYHDVRDVTETFDLVFALEVVEHVPLAEARVWLTALGRHLVPGGVLVLSTPNVYYPPAYLRDITHCTPWCYDELAGMLDLCGFEVERVWRIYHDPVWRVLVRRFVFGWLFRLLGLDYARQIVVVARRRAGEMSPRA